MLPGLPPTTPPMAFADESFQEDQPRASTCSPRRSSRSELSKPTRELMRHLLGSRRTNKLHWHEMDRLQQKDAAYRVAGIEGFHIVAVGTPVPRRRQERARAARLTALVGELHGFGVQHLLIEARSPTSTAETSQQSRAPASPCPKAVASVSTTYPDPSSHCCGLPMWSPASSEPAAKAVRLGLSC